MNTSNEVQVCERDVRFAKWDGNARATTGTGFQYPYCGTLEPGNLYMMTLAGNSNVWRFKKATGAALESSNTVNVKLYESANDADKNWNAIANPTLTYAKSSDAGYAYVYDNITSAYTAYDLTACSFVVGSPFVVQAASTHDMAFTANTTGTILHAPINNSDDAIRYIVTMTDGKTKDYLYLTAHEDAEDRYVIGRDLGKMRSNVPQLWTTAYNEVALAAQDALLTDGEITYLLTLSAPKTTSVTLSANHQDNADLYLMQEGYPICQLSEMPYELMLAKGITTDYYFVVSPKAPQAPTDCTTLKSGVQAIKFMIGGEMYIQINGKIYNVLGGKVK